MIRLNRPGVLVIFTAILILLGALSVTVAAAQDEVEKVTRLLLGFDSQTPGMEVFVALRLIVPAGVEVGTATSQVTFPNTLLSFQGENILH